MGAGQSIWPLLLYGALVVIAASRRRQIEPLPGAAIDETGRGSVLRQTARGTRMPAQSPEPRLRKPTSGRGSISRTMSRFRRSCARRGSREKGGAQRLRGAFLGEAGKTSFGGSTPASMTIDCSQSRPGSCFTRYWRSFAAFVSLYGLVADASTIDSHLSLAAGIFPAGAVDILHEQITKIAAKSDAGLSFGFISGLALALWSANAGMKAIIDAPQRRL
jgi:hypothetical protein